MPKVVAKLPPLCCLEDFAGDWAAYEEALYEIFRQDWVVYRPYYRGHPVGYNTNPVHKNKPEAFWHLISEEDEAGVRLPNLRRCERIRWPKAVIDSSREPFVRVWQNRRADGVRVLLALEDFSYVVVLAIRSRNRFYLATAYPVEHEYRRKTFRKQYERYVREQEGG